jgi:hypothetical protein
MIQYKIRGANSADLANFTLSGSRLQEANPSTLRGSLQQKCCVSYLSFYLLFLGCLRMSNSRRRASCRFHLAKTRGTVNSLLTTVKSLGTAGPQLRVACPKYRGVFAAQKITLLKRHALQPRLGHGASALVRATLRHDHALNAGAAGPRRMMTGLGVSGLLGLVITPRRKWQPGMTTRLKKSSKGWIAELTWKPPVVMGTCSNY